MKKKAGFTIVELLVYSGILIMFLYVMTNIFSEILDVQLESETVSPMVQDSRYILARLNYDIARANSLAQPASLGQQTTNMILQIGNSDYTYVLDNGNLVLTDPVSTDALNSYGTTVSNLTFRRYGNVNGKPSIRIDFTLTTVTQRTNGVQRQDFEATYAMR